MAIVVSGCQECTPALSPRGPRTGPGHFAVRFALRLTPHFATDISLVVTCNGERIDDCYEVIVPDRAWRYANPYRLCLRCGVGVAAYLDETPGAYAVVKAL